MWWTSEGGDSHRRSEWRNRTGCSGRGPPGGATCETSASEGRGGGVWMEGGGDDNN